MLYFSILLFFFSNDVSSSYEIVTHYLKINFWKTKNSVGTISNSSKRKICLIHKIINSFILGNELIYRQRGGIKPELSLLFPLKLRALRGWFVRLISI
jgi:hypothetical protein